MVTKKLKEAAITLYRDGVTDCNPYMIIGEVTNKHITNDQVYEAMKRYGYTWNGVYWSRRLPAWLQKLNKLSMGI